ncbi:DUF6708 domain-containing protein [Proteus myxofaciens]|uniref:DUF6708 domain-containing protein n=1 Tax=Proteus myxofaciens ATCC 19692 TaxID=1354337 RepID=A0A198FG67_9GAMM|nr:DUF6708 domain-containing protein [Proteus myxofaciens]OAT23765.1 hypothetical protein M983_2718 [Proteus myxofaciens ATCC 19692]
MDYYGLHPKFKLNRPLNKNEIAGKLEQNNRIEITNEELIPDIKVIAINSYYLEMVDKYYSSKGIFSFIGIFCSTCIFGVYFLVAIFSNYTSETIVNLIIVGMLAIPMGIFMLFLIKTEWFAWTHYPLRFDRKNQLVHAFRTDGSIITVPWKKVFFTTGLNHIKSIQGDYYISGHVLAEDNRTVIDTFCLPGSGGNLELLKNHWEFVRRYMEEGPEHLIEQVPFCLPIANKKESFGFTFFYISTLFKGIPKILMPLLFPFIFILSIPRYIAILTSRRPIWPQEIEEQCTIEKDDPYVMNEKTNPKDLWDAFY